MALRTRTPGARALLPVTRCRASGQLGALLSSPVLGVRLMTALQVLQVQSCPGAEDCPAAQDADARDGRGGPGYPPGARGSRDARDGGGGAGHPSGAGGAGGAGGGGGAAAEGEGSAPLATQMRLFREGDLSKGLLTCVAALPAGMIVLRRSSMVKVDTRGTCPVTAAAAAAAAAAAGPRERMSMLWVCATTEPTSGTRGGRLNG